MTSPVAFRSGARVEARVLGAWTPATVIRNGQDETGAFIVVECDRGGVERLPADEVRAIVPTVRATKPCADCGGEGHRAGRGSCPYCFGEGAVAA